MAGLAQPDLPAEARERFLTFVEQRAADVDESQIEAGEAVRSGTALRWAGPLAIAAGILLAVLLFPGRTPTLPQDLGFEVTATGLAEVRGEVEGADSIKAEPDTRIQISATPEGSASKGLEFGLYRVEDRTSGLHLVAPEAQLVVDRGAAYFEAVAQRSGRR